MSRPVAIITGAGRGIGRATAEQFDANGYSLALLARSEVELRQSSAAYKDALVLPTDVSDFDALERAVESTLARFGRIDAAIHIAGVAPVLSVEKTSLEDWRKVIDVNLSAAFFLARACWPTFLKQKSGAIVNVSSQAARDPFPGFTAYATAKAGVNMLGLALAREGKAHGIRAYTVAPGAVETAMFRAIFTPEQFPAERTLHPSDVARVIYQCAAGDLRHSSGDVIWMSR